MRVYFSEMVKSALKKSEVEMRKRALVIFEYLLAGIIFFALAAFAQSINEQFEKFTLGELQANSTISHKAKQEGQLDSYVGCLACLRNDVSLCGYSSDPDQCKKDHLLLYGFYRDLLLTKTVTANMIINFRQRGEKTPPDQIQVMANAILAKDNNYCANISDTIGRKTCLAMTTRDPGACPDIHCKNRVYYMQAVESLNIGRCNAIKDERTRMICVGSLATDENQCKQCQSFKTFIKEAYPPQKSAEPYVFKNEETMEAK